jgi:hypothetical protein
MSSFLLKRLRFCNARDFGPAQLCKSKYAERFAENHVARSEGQRLKNSSDFSALPTPFRRDRCPSAVWRLPCPLTRPWVGVETVSSHSFKVHQPIKASVILMNTGRTPAQKMRASFEGHLPTMDAPRPSASSEGPRPSPSSPGVRDYYYPFAGSSALTYTSIRALEGDLVAWIVGRVDYFDHGGIRRYTNVCARLNQGSDDFIPHEEGNDAH